MDSNENSTIRILCRTLQTARNEPGLQWLIGSPFFPPLTIVSTFRCIHFADSDSLSPDFDKESDELRTLLLKGFEVLGALVVGSSDSEKLASHAVEASRKLRKSLAGNIEGKNFGNRDLVGAVVDHSGSDIRFFVSRDGSSSRLESVTSVVYEDQSEKYVWEKGCLLKCKLPIKLPIYYPSSGLKGVDEAYLRAIEAVTSMFRQPKATYILEGLNESATGAPAPVIIRGVELDFQLDFSNIRLSEKIPQQSDSTSKISYFCRKDKDLVPFTSIENADKIQVSVLLSTSGSSLKPAAPIAEYFPEEAKLLVVDHKLEVLCYAAKDLPLAYVVSNLIIPGLVDQLHIMKKMILPELPSQQPKLSPFHFKPPGFVHPVTTIYELSYGETELKQVEVRKLLHSRLGLPFDRPLLRTVSAINFSAAKDDGRSNILQKSTRTSLLKDVHNGIPSSGVSGGVVSLIQGSYEYYHYLHDGFDDSGWGCAYRSLQTIVSWFKLQHYTSIDVPSHREIQQALVEIGDKDPSFIGSREWIGAIELSFVLDKLLGVSCKVINVRSGDELPEKCRELALHFETQGTPIMIGGGVLAYTLLGVDYNEPSGDCAFLILDPHYTGTDDLKKIVNGGWCGWKKAVDSKGKHFFLHNKFYNLLLPQRPNMV